MDHADQRPDEGLIADAAHDPDAFGELYRRHERAMLAFFMRRVGDPETAADMTAETFAAALLARRGYRPERGAPIAWLFGIAHNVLRRSAERRGIEDRARRRLGLGRLELDDADLAAIERIGEEEGIARLLEALPADQAAAVRARVLDEEEYATIAARSDSTLAAVRQRVSRGLASLRSLLEESR